MVGRYVPEDRATTEPVPAVKELTNAMVKDKSLMQSAFDGPERMRMRWTR